MTYFYLASEEKVPVLRIPKLNLVATHPNQITNTLLYYRDQRGQRDVLIPTPEEISEVDRLQVICGFPFMNNDQFIDAEVREGFTFSVNANAFDFMKNLGRDYGNYKRGELYKFQTIEAFGLWFLPEEVMEGIRAYDWNGHLRQINTWMAQRETVLDEAERRGHILRAK